VSIAPAKEDQISGRRNASPAGLNVSIKGKPHNPAVGNGFPARAGGIKNNGIRSCVHRSDHQQIYGRGLERERTPSPFSIDFGGMYGEIARFHKAKRLKTLPLSDFRPENPQVFRKSAIPSKKVLF